MEMNVQFNPLVDSIIHVRHEPVFTKTYKRGLNKAEMGDNMLRVMRFFNLVNLFKLTEGLPGMTGEAGCFRGLSSYLICSYRKLEDPTFDGAGHHIFDSFQGLSEAKPEDATQRGIKSNAQKHRHRASVGIVRKTLLEFPKVELFEGWIPDVMSKGPDDASYRFAHIDVDLYEPTLGAAEYFLPRMVPGGIVVCDDYGYLSWPGATKAIDDSAKRHGFQVACLAAGNAMLMKHP